MSPGNEITQNFFFALGVVRRQECCFFSDELANLLIRVETDFLPHLLNPFKRSRNPLLFKLSPDPPIGVMFFQQPSNAGVPIAFFINVPFFLQLFQNLLNFLGTISLGSQLSGQTRDGIVSGGKKFNGTVATGIEGIYWITSLVFCFRVRVVS